jgi:hypothetical protein
MDTGDYTTLSQISFVQESPAINKHINLSGTRYSRTFIEAILLHNLMSACQTVIHCTRGNSSIFLLQSLYTLLDSQSQNCLSIRRRTRARASEKSQIIIYSITAIVKAFDDNIILPENTSKSIDTDIFNGHPKPSLYPFHHSHIRQAQEQTNLQTLRPHQTFHRPIYDNARKYNFTITDQSEYNTTVLLLQVPNEAYTQRRFGGGRINDEVLSISSADNEETYTDNEWMPFIHMPTLQIRSETLHRNMKSHWVPKHNLAFHSQTHQLLQTVTLSEINELQQICQGTQNTAIIRHTHDHSIYISIKDIQNLISHGKVTQCYSTST